MLVLNDRILGSIDALYILREAHPKVPAVSQERGVPSRDLCISAPSRVFGVLAD